MAAKDFFIYSTLSADNIYAVYEKGGADMPVTSREILVKGGTNVPDRRLVTPLGVVTKVSAEEVDALRANTVFQKHMENGFITISEHKEDPEKVVASEGLESRDASSPLVPGDFEGADGPKPADVAAAEVEEARPQPTATAQTHPAARAPTRRA